MVLWLLAAAITLVVLAIILLPLLRGRTDIGVRADYDITVYEDQLGEVDRDRERGLLTEAQAEAAKIEIKRRMLGAVDAESQNKAKPMVVSVSRSVALGVTLILPVAAVLIYLKLGSPGTPDFPYAARTDIQPPQVAGGAPHQGGGETVDVAAMAARLAERLKEDPSNADGWVLLGRTYMQLNQFDGAIDAYRKALELVPLESDLMTDLGEALTAASGTQVAPESLRLFERAMKIDPYNPKARYYIGMFYAQNGDLQQALQEWVDLIAVSPDDAPWLGMVREQVANVGKELGLAQDATVKPTEEAASLGKRLRAQLAEQAAQAPQGQAPGPTAADVQAAGQMSEDERNAMIQTMVARLEERLQSEPGDLEGWQRLLRAYEVLGNTDKIAEIQAKLKTLHQSVPAGGGAPAAGAAVAPGPTAADVQAAGQMSAGDRSAMILSMVARLEERLKTEPNDLDGWQRLLRAYEVLGNADKVTEIQARIKDLQAGK